MATFFNEPFFEKFFDGFGLATDLYRDGDKYVVMIDLPGVKPENISVDLDGNSLTVSASFEQEGSDRKWLRRERFVRNNAVSRRFTIPSDADIDQISASYVNGVLEITAPIVDAAKPRKIEVQASPAVEAAPQVNKQEDEAKEG